MLDEFSEEESDVFSYGAGDYVLRVNPGIVERFRKKAPKKQKDLFILRSPKYRELHADDALPVRTRYFRDLEELDVDIQMTRTTMIVSSVDENGVIGVHIKHAKIVSAFRRIFRELWNGLEDKGGSV